jgi:hypothetical protein
MITRQVPYHAETGPMRIKLLVGLASNVLSVAMVEGVVRWLYKTPYQWERRLMFFSEGREFPQQRLGRIRLPTARADTRAHLLHHQPRPARDQA